MPYKDHQQFLKYQREYCQKNREKNIADCRKYRIKLREQVLLYYGKGELKCYCCSEDNVEFLSIDHINGGGTQQRKTVRGMAFYLWLKRNNFPTGYRVLCHNCNQSYGFYGYCPHKRD